MMSAFITGNLGADVELRYSDSGQPIAHFRVASTERWDDKKHGRQERTEWMRVVVFGKHAENCHEFLRKGSGVAVEGRLQSREYEKDGIKRWSVEIVASQVEFTDRR